MQVEYKTEKRGTLFIRRLTEIWTRARAKVFWVKSGHMIADGLTKASNTSPSPNLDLLCYAVEYGTVCITCCTDSWRKEMAMTEASNLHELKVMDPSAWNPQEDVAYDTQSGNLLRQAALTDKR